MTALTHALLIRKEPLDQILAGTKTWEIRGSATKRRGPIALIESHGGTVDSGMRCVIRGGAFEDDVAKTKLAAFACGSHVRGMSSRLTVTREQNSL